MLEGVDVVMEAEEKDLSVGVVCKKKVRNLHAEALPT